MQQQNLTTERPDRVFIGLGSNLGDSALILREAWQRLGELPGNRCVAISSPYISAPVDMHSTHWFTNAVGELRTSHRPLKLLEHLLAVEAAMGRKRDPQFSDYQDRVLDLDLLYCGEVKVDTPALVLPHPQRCRRLFVLSPLAEIAPDFLDCVDGRTIIAIESHLRRRMAAGAEPVQEIQRTYWYEQ
jgi:2-amino-4-hydroxy-6-hydroxymethyldihydropteridine diphosphokinase